SPSIRYAQSFIHKMHQPYRSDEQELHILQERWLLSLNLMPVKLTDPGDHKDDQAYEPQWREVKTGDNICKHQAQHPEQHHPDTQGNGQGNIIDDYKDQSHPCPIGVRISRSQEGLNNTRRYGGQQPDNTEKDQRYTNPVYDLVGLVLVAFTVLVQ